MTKQFYENRSKRFSEYDMDETRGGDIMPVKPQQQPKKPKSYGFTHKQAYEFAKIKRMCKALASNMPFDSDSARRIQETIDLCGTPKTLFWNFLFDFYQDDILKDIEQRFPGMKQRLDYINKRNMKMYRIEEAHEQFADPIYEYDALDVWDM